MPGIRSSKYAHKKTRKRKHFQATDRVPGPGDAPVGPLEQDALRGLRLPDGLAHLLAPRRKRRNNRAHTQPSHAHVRRAA